jgi:hypothetical protein
LFALDAKLNIASGFIYHTDCEALRRSGIGGSSPYCGGDFSDSSIDGSSAGFGDAGSDGSGGSDGGDGGGDSGGGDSGGGCGGSGGIAANTRTSIRSGRPGCRCCSRSTPS